MKMNKARQKIFKLYNKVDLITFLEESLSIMKEVKTSNGFEQADIEIQVENIKFALQNPDHEFYPPQEVATDVLHYLKDNKMTC